MTEGNHLYLPILRGGPRKDLTGPTGALASIGDTVTVAAGDRIASLAIDSDSLARVVAAVLQAAHAADAAIPADTKMRLSAFEVSLGITAAGSVGLLGTGVNVECEASFTLTFERGGS